MDSTDRTNADAIGNKDNRSSGEQFLGSMLNPQGIERSQSATAKKDHGPYHNRISDSSSGENTKQHEAVLSTEDEANASLPLSNIKENSRSQPFSSTTDTKLHGSFRKRLNTYTDNSAKPANEYEKSSTNSSPGPRGLRRFGHPGSVSVQANNLADSSMSRATSVRSSVTQRSSGTQALLAHLLRPTSWIPSAPGHELLSLLESGNASDSKNLLGDNKPKFGDQFDPKEKLEIIRYITDTEIKPRALDNPDDAAHRPDDSRTWHTRNLRCSKCYGACPVCDYACCVYEGARRIVDDPCSEVFRTEQAENIVSAIGSLGRDVKDLTTFSKCTVYGGCGRLVCSRCCGICSNEACRDIQCRECKPDPWGSCDWHG